MSREPRDTFAEWFAWASLYIEAAGETTSTSRVRIDEEGRILFWEDRFICRTGDSESLFAVAEWYVTREWADRLTARYVVCHAATLAAGRKAVLLVGRPGAGKSSLAFALVKRGWRFLGDEFALICPETLQVLPFPSALRIKNEGLVDADLKDPHFEILSYAANDRERKSFCCFPRKAIVPAPESSFPVRRIVFLRSDAEAGRLVSIPRWQAARWLYECTWSTGEGAFHTVAGLAQNAEVHALGRAPLNSMTECIIALDK